MNGLANTFAIIFLILASFAIVLRFFATILQKRPIPYCDVWLVGTLVTTAVACIYAIAYPRLYYRGYPQKNGWFETFYAIAMWIIRVTTVLLYRNIFRNRNLYRLSICTHVAWAMLYTPLMAIGVNCLLQQEAPWDNFGGPRFFRDDPAQDQLDTVIIIHSVVSLVFTLLLAALPFPWIFPIQINNLTPWLKISLLFITASGCILASLIRLTYATSATTLWKDYHEDIAVWGCIEMCFNIMALSVPARSSSTSGSETGFLMEDVLVRTWDAWKSFGKHELRTQDVERAQDAEREPLVTAYGDHIAEEERQAFRLSAQAFTQRTTGSTG